ncbi:hypothetical protein EON62_03630 [archaeon]|nr:MAG: hypothetical protein EON62_03630 [archaeon]
MTCTTPRPRATPVRAHALGVVRAGGASSFPHELLWVRACVVAGIDGAYFGTTFPHLFLMTFAACVPQPPLSIYVPRVFGFRVRREPLPDVAAAAAAASEGSAEAAAGAGRAAGSADLDSVIQRLGAASLVPATMAGIKPVRAIGPAGLPAEVLKDAVPRSEATHTAALGAVGDRGELFERRGENGEGEDEDEDEEDESDDADLEEATSAAAPPSESGAAAVATGAE